MLTISTFFYRGHAAVGVNVAGAGAVLKLGNRVVGRGRLLIFLVRTCFEVVRVARSAIGRVAGARVRHTLRIGFVTVDTIQRLGVGTWIRRRFVRVFEHWQPRGGAVTIDTFHRGHEMVGRLAGRLAAIVAGAAIARHASMVKAGR